MRRDDANTSGVRRYDDHCEHNGHARDGGDARAADVAAGRDRPGASCRGHDALRHHGRAATGGADDDHGLAAGAAPGHDRDDANGGR